MSIKLCYKRIKINYLPRTRWWHLKGIKQLAFKEKLLDEATWSHVGNVNTMWDTMASCIRKVTKEVLRESRGKGPLGKKPSGGVRKFKRLLGPRGIYIEIYQSVRMLKLLISSKKRRKKLSEQLVRLVLLT